MFVCNNENNVISKTPFIIITSDVNNISNNKNNNK